MQGKSQDQPYQIVYGAAALFGEAAYLYVLAIFSTLAAYLVFLVPISYQRSDQIRQTWQVGIWVLWLFSFLSGIIVIGLHFVYNREISWVGWVAFLTNWALLSIVLALSFLGLYPTSAFVPSIALATTLTYFLLNQLYAISLRYKHYLSRSITFAQHGSIFLSLISAVSLFQLFGITVRSILSPERQFTSSFILSILELIGLGVITYFAANINLNDPRSSRFKTIVSVPICFVVVIAKYIDRGYLSFWWLGMAALLSSVFYSAHSPTKRKSTGVAIGLYSAMSVAIFLDSTTFRPSADQIWTVIKDVILPILGLLVALVVGGESVIKTLFPKLRSQKISKADVSEASKDFIEVDGLSVESIDQIMRIAILSHDFDFCDTLLSARQSFQSYELRNYFEIFYLCVRFSFEGQVRVAQKDSEQNVWQYVVIITREDFTDYINDVFPAYVGNYDIWNAYVAKGYIRQYISDKTFNKARSETFYTRLITYARNAFLVLMAFLVFSSQILTPWLNSLPSLVSQIASWNSVRKNEARLLLSVAMQPFQLDDASIRHYYAFSMWDWIQYREFYAGNRSSEHFYMPKEAMEMQLRYLETLFSFYEGQDDFFFELSNELGGYYKGLDDCHRALDYFEEVIAEATSIEYRDFAIATSAECYRKPDLPRALSLLEEAQNDTKYVKSRSLLAEIYYQQQKYSEVVELLGPMSDSLNLITLSLMGESLYYEGEYTQSITVLEEVLAKESLADDYNREIRANLYLGAAYFGTNNFFKSAEYYFRAFSDQLCPSASGLSQGDVELHIPRFKSAIDFVIDQNPNDFRTNLWNFVYFLYIGETKQASKFFNAHLVASPTYEQKFTQCLIEMSKSKKSSQNE